MPPNWHPDWNDEFKLSTTESLKLRLKQIKTMLKEITDFAATANTAIAAIQTDLDKIVASGGTPPPAALGPDDMQALQVVNQGIAAVQTRADAMAAGPAPVPAPVAAAAVAPVPAPVAAAAVAPVPLSPSQARQMAAMGAH